jgi:hypothetical protein
VQICRCADEKDNAGPSFAHPHIKKDTRGCLFSLGLLNASNAEKKRFYIAYVLLALNAVTNVPVPRRACNVELLSGRLF